MLNPARSNLQVSWHERRRLDGEDIFRVGTAAVGDLLVAEWPGLGRLTCTRDGARSRFVAERGAEPVDIEKLRAGAVRALVGDARGEIGIHASAVDVGGRAILIIGKSGAGKSTAAGELCLRNGARLLADDVALVAIAASGAVSVRPSERHHSLTPRSMRLLRLERTERTRSRGAKALVRAARLPRAPVPLALIVVLRSDGRRRAPALRPLRGAEAALAVLKSVVRFDRRAAQRRHLDQVLSVCERCRMVEVARPARAASASLVGELLLAELRSSEKEAVDG